MARRFNFRYETLLKIRRQREDQHKRLVGERLRQITESRHRLQSLHGQIQDEEDAIRSGQGTGTIDLQQVIRHRHWLGHLHKSVLDTEASIRTLEARLAQERAALAEAMKQRKILEKLKERRLERHMQEQDREESRAADDLTTVRFVYRESVALDEQDER